jgi:hypothetical protein
MRHKQKKHGYRTQLTREVKQMMSQCEYMTFMVQHTADDTHSSNGATVTACIRRETDESVTAPFMEIGFSYKAPNELENDERLEGR